jgi:acyl-CoA thioesterase FadM
VDVHLEVASLGRTSITYRMTIRRAEEVCVQVRAVAVLLDQARGRPVEWPDDYRRLLSTSGDLPPEKLTGAEPTPAS